ncbi:amidase [Streptomyces longwoodensis]|uniref:amidase n=1 Tax=Streptomyces longwoodensis TaxID=68231 RepID=UPI0036FA7E16
MTPERGPGGPSAGSGETVDHGTHAHSLAAAVRAGRVRAVDVVADALQRIARTDRPLCAFREVWEEDALRRAAEVDARVAAGERLPLAGVPFAVKGRHGLRSAGPLVAAGCVAVGATAVPGPGTPWQTWGLGRYGRTVNPWRADRTPGGSSAGAAVAVAAGVVPLATGGDGAGSVRIPAAWCGVLGLKTTNGRLPSADRTGLAAPGVLVRCATDARAWWTAVTVGAAGTTARMAGTAGTGVTEEGAAVKPRPLRAVWSPDLGFADVDPEPVAVAHAAALRLADSGAVRIDQDLPGPRDRRASRDRRAPRGRRPAPEGAPLWLEDPADAWLALRTASGDDPLALALARRIRAANDRRLDALFRRADLLLTPTTPCAAHGHEGPGERYSTALTWSFNLSGHPALSIPAGFGSDGCPLGLQVVAPRGGERLLLDFAERLYSNA